jgi:hypothetical protein
MAPTLQNSNVDTTNKARPACIRRGVEIRIRSGGDMTARGGLGGTLGLVTDIAMVLSNMVRRP